MNREYPIIKSLLDADFYKLTMAQVAFEAFLRSKRITHLHVGGLATDYCVKATVLDALKKGFKVTLECDAIRAVNLHPDDGKKAIQEMVNAGAILSS